MNNFPCSDAVTNFCSKFSLIEQFTDEKGKPIMYFKILLLNGYIVHFT